jgi:hypothetical protein
MAAAVVGSSFTDSFFTWLRSHLSLAFFYPFFAFRVGALET